MKSNIEEIIAQTVSDLETSEGLVEQGEQEREQEQEQVEQEKVENVQVQERLDVSKSGVKKSVGKLKRLRVALRKVVYGRDGLVDAVLFGLASNQHVLIIGAHGEAKSLLAKKLVEFSGLQNYSVQVHNETMVKDIVGLIDPVAYKEGRLELLKTRFWGANVLYFDEFLRGRTEFLDFLLEVLQERKCSKTVLGEVDLPLVSVVCTSNPLTDDYNTERLDLALKDRFGVIAEVGHLINSAPGVVESVLKEHDEGLSFNGRLKIGRDELRAIPVWADKHVETDTGVVRVLFEMLNKKEFVFSTRFIKRFNLGVKVWALLNGRKEASNKDYLEAGKLLLGNREDGLSGSVIKGCLEEAFATKRFEPYNKKLNQLGRKSGIEFVKGFVDVIHELKGKSEAYIPDSVREKRDKLERKFSLEFRSVHDVISRDVELLKKFQGEYFRKWVAELAELNEIETAYLEPEKSGKFAELIKKVDRGGKLFDVEFDENEVIRDDNRVVLTKWSVAPKVDVPESFNKIKGLRVKVKPFTSRS